MAASFGIASAVEAVGQTSLDIPSARKLAYELVAAGRHEEASALAQTLLQRDAEDHDAWMALAQAERNAGRNAASLKAAKTAWRVANSDPQRYASAVVVAQTLFADNKKLRAQLWLRRAAQAAPNEAFKEKAAQSFRNARAATPLRAELRFAVTPSSNINNGSSSEFTVINGLAFALTGENRALSGMSYRLGGSLDYDIALSQRQTVTLGVSADTYHYTLSSRSKAIAPNLKASDLAFQELQVSARTRRIDEDGKAVTTAGLSVGQNWYGGSVLTRFVTGEIGRQFALSDGKAQAGVRLSGERQWRDDNAQRNANIWTISGNYGRALGNGDIMTVSGRLQDTSSAAASRAHEALRFDLGYRFANPVLGKARLELTLGAETRRYDRAIVLSPNPREDLELSAAATVVLGDLDYFGFSPTATLSGSKTSSNIDVYDSNTLGVSFGLRSSF